MWLSVNVKMVDGPREWGRKHVETVCEQDIVDVLAPNTTLE